MEKPLILDFTENLTPNEMKDYHYYDKNLNLNVIDVNSSQIPYIESNKKGLELITKTFVEREADDEDDCHLEAQTNTRVQREQDDLNTYCFLELSTITKVQRESDDE